VVPEKWKRLAPEEVELRPNVPDSSEIPHSIARFPDLRRRMAAYFGMIENLDWNIGRLVDAIDTIPALENTLVVYISDHGEFLGSHGRIERKELPHEESIRIPTVFRWKGVIPAQGIRPELFSLVDLQKTVLGLTGIEAPRYDQGFDYSGTILGKDSPAGQDRVLIEMHGSPRWILDEPDWRGVLTKEWKYVFFDNGSELLFDLENDPYELNYLSMASPDRVEAMKTLLLSELERTREPYFDVLIQNGETPAGPVTDVSAL
jgi:arylsulfatase A-like enzyme